MIRSHHAVVVSLTSLVTLSCSPLSRTSDEEHLLYAESYYQLGEYQKSIASAEKVDPESKAYGNAMKIAENAKHAIANPTDSKYDHVRYSNPPLW